MALLIWATAKSLSNLRNTLTRRLRVAAFPLQIAVFLWRARQDSNL